MKKNSIRRKFISTRVPKLSITVCRYPFTAAEILASDSMAITNFFFRSKGQKDDKSDDEESEEVIIDTEGMKSISVVLSMFRRRKSS